MQKAANSILKGIYHKKPCVLITILSHNGSTPRSAGSKMVLFSDGTIEGTIGGGLLEAKAMQSAADVLIHGGFQIHKFALNAKDIDGGVDMICGGEVRVLIERIDPADESFFLFSKIQKVFAQNKCFYLISILPSSPSDNGPIERYLVQKDDKGTDGTVWPPVVINQFWDCGLKHNRTTLVETEGKHYWIEPLNTKVTVYIFGAGHVSQEIAALTPRVDFGTVIIDDRREFANALRFAQADHIKVIQNFDHALDGLPIDANSFIVIVTRGHLHDRTVLARALRTDAGYIGMIGSRRKRDTIYKSLSLTGYTAEDLARVYSPIGLEIESETPAEIAVSIVGEMIKARATVS